MAIDQRRFAESTGHCLQRAGQQLMVGPMHFIDAPMKLGSTDPSPPKGAVPVCPGWNETQPITGARPDRRRANSLDRCGIDLLLVAIAVDDGTRNILNERAES